MIDLHNMLFVNKISNDGKQNSNKQQKQKNKFLNK